jgi:hypothetical protein
LSWTFRGPCRYHYIILRSFIKDCKK